MVPIPPESPPSPGRTFIPDESTRLPHRPKDAKQPNSTNAKLWTFRYEGDSGPDLDVVEFTPIELQTAELVTVQFNQDTSPEMRSESRFVENGAGVVVLAYFNYDDSVLDEAPADGQFRLLPVGPGQFKLLLGLSADPASEGEGSGGWYTSILGGPANAEVPGPFTNYGPIDENPHLLEGTHLIIHSSTQDQVVGAVGTPQDGHKSWVYVITGVDSTLPNKVDFDLELVSEAYPGVPLPDNELAHILLVIPQAPTEVKPNAAIRARVRYSVGSSDDIEVNCDWRGKLQVMAKRISLERVTVVADREAPFEPHRVRLSAVAMVGGSPPLLPLTLTDPGALVLSGASRTLDIPLHAARLSILLRWGLELDDPGDAPLGQVFVAFVTEAGNAIGFVDAMSSREALLGEGVPVPAGAVQAILSNRVPDADLRLGAVWHLQV